MERGGYRAAPRRSFLACLPYLLAVAQAQALRHLSRLMPLLLEWLHVHDRGSRLGALVGLRLVMQSCWVRLPAHAGLVWEHLVVVAAEEVAAGSRPDAAGDAGMGAAMEQELLLAAQLLGCCGGGAVAEAARATACQAAAAGGGILHQLVTAAQCAM
jgi:hypothetical protein